MGVFDVPFGKCALLPHEMLTLTLTLTFDMCPSHPPPRFVYVISIFYVSLAGFIFFFAPLWHDMPSSPVNRTTFPLFASFPLFLLGCRCCRDGMQTCDSLSFFTPFCK